MDAQNTQTQAPDAMFRLMTWLHENRRQVVTGTVVVVVLAIAAGVYAWKKSSDETNADAQLMDLSSVPGANAPVGMVSATPYLDLARQYPGTPAGADAQLLGAQALFVEGNYAEAEHEFSQFLSDHPESDLLAEAMIGVAASLEAQGKTSEAMRKYQEVISAYPSDAGVVEPAKLTMARMSEAANKPQEALTYYSELARSQNPYDPWAAEARERAVLLLAHHPEFRKAQAQAQAPSENPFATAPSGSFAPGPPVRQEGPPAGAQMPQPSPGSGAPARQANPGLNFLSVPNKPSKPAPQP
jgi:hypothetical protein